MGVVGRGSDFCETRERAMHRTKCHPSALGITILLAVVLGGCAKRDTAERPSVGKASQALVSGLVAAYGFEEGTGAVSADASGNNLTATISGATWARGKFGNALKFNGYSDWVTIADAAPLHLTSGMTLSAWVHPIDPIPSWSMIVLKETSNHFSYALYASASQGPGGYILSGGVEYSAGQPQDLPRFAWSHVAAAYDGATMSLYVNGALVASTPFAVPIDPSTDVLRIGGNSIWDEYFSGLIDEVRVYNRSLSASEIATDMTSAVAPAGPQLPLMVGDVTVHPYDDNGNADLLWHKRPTSPRQRRSKAFTSSSMARPASSGWGSTMRRVPTKALARSEAKRPSSTPSRVGTPRICSRPRPSPRAPIGSPISPTPTICIFGKRATARSRCSPCHTAPCRRHSQRRRSMGPIIGRFTRR